MTSRPPFELPSIYRIKPGVWQERRVAPYSDGEQHQWPGGPGYRPCSETFYLCFLGIAWAAEEGIAKPMVNHYLDKLPDGYGLFEINQPSGPHIYKRLFGHPSGAYYDSTLKFQVHFLWLMSGMENDCTCHLCTKKSHKAMVSRRRPDRDVLNTNTRDSSRVRRGLARDSESPPRSDSANPAARRVQRSIRQAGAPYAQDEEGTEDVFKNCIKRLEATKGGKQGIEIDIEEANSIDWRAERETLLPYLTQIEQQHSFIPRLGELVLWCPDVLDDHYLTLDIKTFEYKFYSFEQACFHGFPAWRGGVVATVPSIVGTDSSIDVSDILDTPKKRNAPNISGFRIETIPDPNEDMDKALSKQYRYVPLKNIRPLSHWQLILHGLPSEKWHPSINFALTCMTSMSLLEKWRFNGTWPDAHISCKAMYLGSELITIGDAVRLAGLDAEQLSPTAVSDQISCSDVLIVDSIRLHLLDIQADHISPDSPYLSSHTTVTLVGKSFTLDITRAYRQSDRYNIDTNESELDDPVALEKEDVKSLFRAVGASEYGNWYVTHAPQRKYEVSYEQVLGRLHEADAVRLWTGQTQHRLKNGEQLRSKPNLEFDVSGINSARKFATQTDERIPEAAHNGQIFWHLADNRVESLAIESLNGLDVGKYHDIRDAATLKAWRAQLKVFDGHPLAAEQIQDAALPARRGRPPGSKIVDGKLVLPDNTGYDSDVQVKAKPKPNSQMAGAALASTDEDEYDKDEDHDERAFFDAPDFRGHEIDNIDPYHAPPMNDKGPPSKAQIMSTIEVAEAFEDDYSDDSSSDGNAWLEGPVPPFRGGTEESEGGDYDPRKPELHRRSASRAER